MVIAGAALSTLCLGLEAAQAQPKDSSNNILPLSTVGQDVLVVPPNALDRPTYSVITGLATFLATGKETGGQFSLFDLTVPPQAGPPPIIQTQQDEGLYILDGQMSILLGNEGIIGTPGTFVYFPKGRRHTYQNIGTTPAKALLLTTPSGFEGFYREEGRNTLVTDRSNPPEPLRDFAVIGQIAAKYGSQLALSPETTDLPPDFNFVVVPPNASNRPSFSKAGGLYTSLASVEETNGQFSLFDISLTPQSVSEQLMSNDQESQSFYVLDGDVTFQIDDQSIVGTPGTFVYVPQGTPYAFQNQGTSKARTLLLSKPASVPEPAFTVSLLIFGLCGTVSLLKRKHQQQPLG